jgi:hypothetical protein
LPPGPPSPFPSPSPRAERTATIATATAAITAITIWPGFISQAALPCYAGIVTDPVAGSRTSRSGAASLDIVAVDDLRAAADRTDQRDTGGVSGDGHLGRSPRALGWITNNGGLRRSHQQLVAGRRVPAPGAVHPRDLIVVEARRRPQIGTRAACSRSSPLSRSPRPARHPSRWLHRPGIGRGVYRRAAVAASTIIGYQRALCGMWPRQALEFLRARGKQRRGWFRPAWEARSSCIGRASGSGAHAG